MFSKGARIIMFSLFVPIVGYEEELRQTVASHAPALLFAAKLKA
jgi:hypothetical protein